MAMSESEMIPLRIDRMPGGGFVVSEAPQLVPDGRQYGPLFACTHIGEALVFIHRQIEPGATSAPPCARCKSLGKFKCDGIKGEGPLCKPQIGQPPHWMNV